MTPLTHERVTMVAGARTGLPLVVAVHSTALGQAVGGCRLWHYESWLQGVDDALRLSSAMTLKTALSGLPLGGGKSVIALPVAFELTPALRRDVMLDLGDVIESLDGVYGVGEDVGTTAEDMLVVSERTSHAYGLPVANGGMGETSEPTAVGVHESLKVTAEHLWGSPDLSGRHVTVIGLGQVGRRLAERLVADGAKVTATDIDPAKRELGFDWVPVDEALSLETDLLVPAALGGLLDHQTAEVVQCAAILGPANNQLATDDVAERLAERGILWAPDFLVNAGGVIYGANVELGKLPHDQAMVPVLAIADTLRDVYGRATSEGVPPLVAATRIAHDRIAQARS